MTTANKILVSLVLRPLVPLGLVATAACAPSASSPSGAALPASVAIATSGSLDGRVFAVEGQNVPPGHASTDEVSFAGGKLDSSACRERGLAPIAYTVREDGTFYAERRASDEHDTWTGRVTGDHIEGLYTSEHGGAVTMRIPFKGQTR